MIDVVATHVILLVAVATDPSGTVVARSAADALAAPFAAPPRVVLRSTSRAPAQADIDGLVADAKAESAVILDCAAPGCARAEVRAAPGRGPWVTRTLRFGAQDELAERGRAIGLLASTLMPESWSRSSAAGATKSPGPAPSAPPTVVTAAAAIGPAIAPGTSWGLDAMAGLFGGGGGVSDVGLALGVQRAIGRGFAARAGFKLELGELAQQAGSLRGIGGQLGLAWMSAARDRPGQLFWGAEADVIAMSRRIHLAVDGDDSRTSLALGGDAIGLVGYSLSPSVAGLLGVGVEALKGTGADDDGGRDPTHLPPAWRLLFSFGILARF